MRKTLLPAVLTLVVCMSACRVVAQDVPAEEDASNASAEMTTSGRRISGLPELRFGKGMDCTFFGALNACLRHLGEQVSYEYLMGVSGAAFATRFRKDWSPSSADPTVTPDHAKTAMEAVGYSYDWIGSGMPDAGQLVMDSVGAGVPVVGMQLSGYPDWGLIVGYTRGGDTWVCRTYHDKGSAYWETMRLSPSMLLLGEKGKAPGMSASVRRSIELAVQFGKGEKKPSDPRYEAGPGAFDAWIAALQSPELAQTTGKQLETIQHINAWLYGCLIDARTAGVTYLRWAAKLLKDDAGKSAGEAADLYDEEVEALTDAREFAPYPSQNEPDRKWTSEMRAKQIEALKAALDKEKEAIAALEKAMSGFETPEDGGQEN